jgi:hypothetical protein
MIKTKIAFEDIRAGDLLEVVVVDSGVKTVLTGIAFHEQDWMPKSQPRRHWWETSEGGMIAVAGEEGGVIYRIDVREVGFSDVQIGDLIRVTYEPIKGDMIEIVKTGVVYTNHNGAWVTPAYETLVTNNGRGKIEILERVA